jgi:hypothetical protein
MPMENPNSRPSAALPNSTSIGCHCGQCWFTGMGSLTDKCSISYSITSSARASTACGTTMPSALAVLRLTTNSYLVGA